MPVTLEKVLYQLIMCLKIDCLLKHFKMSWNLLLYANAPIFCLIVLVKFLVSKMSILISGMEFLEVWNAQILLCSYFDSWCLSIILCKALACLVLYWIQKGIANNGIYYTRRQACEGVSYVCEVDGICDNAGGKIDILICCRVLFLVSIIVMLFLVLLRIWCRLGGHLYVWACHPMSDKIQSLCQILVVAY